MRVSNPLANSYTKNQADSQFLTVDISGSESGTANSVNADTLNGKPASDYVLKNELYPVGSIYMSINPTDPSTYFGGTWEKIQGKFLLSESTSHIAGTTGGSSQVTLSTNNMPKLTGTINKGYTVNWGTAENNVFFQVSVTEPVVASPSAVGGSPVSSNQLGAYQAGNGITISGDNKPIDILPPYLSVYMWKRTA